MSKLEALEKYARDTIQDHPELEDSINNIVDLFKSECEDDFASVENEYDIAIQAIQDLLEQ